MDPRRRQALSDFYREEFLRYLHHLESNGTCGDAGVNGMARLCERFVGDLDRVCCCARFPAVAETLLQRFDTLTGLSQLAPRKGH